MNQSIVERIDQLRWSLGEADDVTLRRKLSEELYFANRERVFAPRSDWDRSQWRAIPSIAWVVERQSSPEAFRADIRTFISGFGAAVLAALGVADELGFVNLVRAEAAGGSTRLDVICPHAAPLELMRASRQGDPVARERFVAGLSGADVLHRYGVVPDRWVPVVVGWEPARRRLVLTNANQLDAPDQFIDPALCHTTSGLLNLVGTLALHTRGVAFDDLQRHMNCGLDEWFRWLYCATDTGLYFDPDLLLVSRADPEHYVYDYDGAPAHGAA
ncbi:MAG: hypothetical protein ACTHOE_03195 [Conexibacter sp.]